MVSNNSFMHNGATVGRFSSIDNAGDFRVINYPGILQDMYYISKFGKVYSTINDSYIAWSIRNNLPYVNLSCNIDGHYQLEPFNIKDLVAYSFLDNSKDYLERGCRVVNIDGDPMNCSYHNVIYLS